MVKRIFILLGVFLMLGIILSVISGNLFEKIAYIIFWQIRPLETILAVTILLFFLFISKLTKKDFILIKGLGIGMLVYFFSFIIISIPVIGFSLEGNLGANANINWLLPVFSILLLIITLAYLIIAIGILRYKNWGRIGGTHLTILTTIVYCGMYFIPCFFDVSLNKAIYLISVRAVACFSPLLFLFFLTRPKIKEQFR